MAYRPLPLIDPSGDHRIALDRAFGSPEFKPNFSLDLLGWVPSGEHFLLLRHAAPTWLQHWDAATGAWVRSVELGPTWAFAALRVDAAHALVASRADEDAPAVAELWDLSAPRRVAALAADGDVGDELAASADGSLAVLAYHAFVSAYALPSGERTARVRGRHPVAASPDGSLFLAASRAALTDLCVWRRDGSPFATIRHREARFNAAAFSADGAAVVAGLSDGALACWDLATAAPRWITPAHVGRVAAVERSPDGATYFTLGTDDHLCATGADGTLRWRVALRRRRARSAPRRRSRWQVSPSPDGALLVVATPGSALRVFEAATGAERSSVDGHDGSVTCVAFSTDGTLLASGATDGDVRVYDLSTGETAWTLEVDADHVRELSFAPDRAAVRTAGNDHVVRAWNLATGFEESRWPTYGGHPLRTQASPDGSRLLVRTGDRLELWSDRARERVVWSTDDLPARIHTEVFSADGAQVLLAGNGNDPGDDQAWWRRAELDAASGRRVGQPALIRGRLLGLVAGDEGPRSIAQDGDALVVTEEYGRRRARRFAYGATPAAIVRLSTDGRWLLIGDRRRVEVWELGAEIRRAGQVDFGRSSDRVGAFAVAPDGSRFAIGTKRGCALVFALAAVDR